MEIRRLIAERQSYLIALGLAAGLIVWMASGGPAGGAARPGEPSEAGNPSPARPFRVRVRVLEAEPVRREIVVRGRTAPARAVTLRAEIDARVVAVPAERGARVAEGDAVVRLDMRDREARLRQAQASVQHYQLEHEAYERLEQSKFQSETGLAEASAKLAAARAEVRRVEVDIANTRIVAPFDGVLDTRPVEVGDYVSAGDAVARVIERDPILVTGHVTQHELHRLHVGDEAAADVVTGDRLEGRIRYVASESDPATRTFKVEMEAANPDETIPAGVSAEIRIPTATVAAHFVSPALLTLSAEDEIGVKSVDDHGTVHFHPVTIVKASPRGVWVSGLPERVRIITVGQGFVHAGDRVEAVTEDEASPAEAPSPS